MMMKVALLLLALVAPMISASGGCHKLARKVKRSCGECNRLSPLHSWAQDCCKPCPGLKCPEAWDKLKTCPKKCKKLHKLADRWGCEKPKHSGYGHGEGGYDYSTCELYPYKTGDDYGECNYECNPFPERNYDYGHNPTYKNLCPQYKKTEKPRPRPYSYIEKEKSYGYGPDYDNNKCPDKPRNVPEYLYAAEICGYDSLVPEKKCPKCPKHECDYPNRCKEPKYQPPPPPAYDCTECANCPGYGYSDAALGTAGETTNETVQTLSWVLIAIAAALFLASIAFCAVGRRERKAHAAENVHVNALA